MEMCFTRDKEPSEPKCRRLGWLTVHVVAGLFIWALDLVFENADVLRESRMPRSPFRFKDQGLYRNVFLDLVFVDAMLMES